MIPKDCVRECAVKAWIKFSERDLDRFEKLIEVVQARVVAWLESELEERRAFDFDDDKEKWESVVPRLVEGIKDGELWL